MDLSSVIEWRWSDLSYLLVEYNRVDLFIVFPLLPSCPLSMLVFHLLGLWCALRRCPFYAPPWVLVPVWDFCGALVYRVRKPSGCDCPLPCDAKASKRISLCFPLHPSSVSRSFTHDCRLLVCQSSRIRVVSIDPQDMLLGMPTFTLSRVNTRTHDCFPAKQDLSYFPPRILWHSPDKLHRARF